jgi:hypothetical protein
MDAGGLPPDRPLEDPRCRPDRPLAQRAELRCEGLAAIVLWAYLFALIAALAMGRSGAAAVFLNCHGPRALGAVYVLVALTIAGLVYGLARFAESAGQTATMLVTSAVAGMGAVAVCLVARRSHAEGIDPVYLALYVAVETFAFLAPLQFWTLANGLFDWAGARRRYAFITTGGILGSMAGGAAVRLLDLPKPLSLLWPLALLTPVIAASILALSRLRARMPRSQAGAETVVSGWATGRVGNSKSSHALNHLLAHSPAQPRSAERIVAAAPWRGISTRLGILALLTVATTTLVDFYFKMSADHEYQGHARHLSQFFGNYYLAVGAATLALQLLVTPVVLRREGPFGGLVLMPVALGAVAVANLLIPTLLGAAMLKLVDSSFSHSVQRSCREMLYTAIPTHLVGGVQALADGIWGRIGLLGCGVVLMVFGPHTRLDAWLGAIAAIVFLWLVALWIVQRAYQNRLPVRQVPRPHANWQGVQQTR